MFTNISNTLKDFTDKRTEIGKTIKSSKVKYSWRFELKGIPQTIDLFFSKLSKKIKILINGNICFNKRVLLKFDFKILIEENEIEIFKKSFLSNEFLIKINGKTLKSLETWKKNQAEEKGLNQNDFPNKKNRFFSFNKYKSKDEKSSSDKLNNSNHCFKHEINYLKISNTDENMNLIKQLNMF